MAVLALVDATYELFRAYFGAPPRKSPDGREVGASRGLVASLVVLLRDEGVTHVGCATDHVIESFRNDLYPGYKTGDGMDPDLFGQFQIVEELMRALGLVVWPMVDFEADDALATAAARFSTQAERVLLATVDKDLAQAVRGEHVVMVDRRRKTTMDEAGVVAKFGVPPSLIPDYLGLIGDAADGYPGLPGWGAKTAAAVLSAHGPIEAIPDDPGAWKAKVRGAEKLARTLAERRDEAMLFKKLATLRTDAPLTETFDDLAWRGARPELVTLTRELGFEDVCERVPRWQ
jgi:5'-3' exonuclease